MRNEDVKAAVRRKLKLLVEAIIDEAVENPNFMIRLGNILVRSNDENTDRLSERVTSPKKESGPNLLEILHASGESALKERLDGMAIDELVRACVQEGLRKQKEAKTLERAELVALLLEMARNRLRQGESFVRRGA